jgi:hypothetical protein
LEKDPKNDDGKRQTKSQICKKIGICDSSLKRTVKHLNIKSFYRRDVSVNKRKPNKKKNNETVSRTRFQRTRRLDPGKRKTFSK